MFEEVALSACHARIVEPWGDHARLHREIAASPCTAEDTSVDIRDTRYAKTQDGVYIAYQTAGEGPIDLVYQLDFMGNIDLVWEWANLRGWLPGLAAFCRVILHDRRGTGLSSRNLAPPNLETRVSDLHLVLDAVSSDRPVLAGFAEVGGRTSCSPRPTPSASARSCGSVRYHASYGHRTSRGASRPNYLKREDSSLELWGTREYGVAAAEVEAEWTEGYEPYPQSVPMMGMMGRQTTTPDVARELTRIWRETDVRRVLPSVQAPALLVAEEGDANDVQIAEYVASLMPDAQVALTPD